MRVLVTRPTADATGTALQLRQMGHIPLISPMLEVRFRDGPELSLAGVQALVATSANGIRAFIRRTTHRDLPVFAVGAQTAKVALEAGFADVKHSVGDSIALANAIAGWAKPEAGILFHAAGNETAGKLAEHLRGYGFKFHRDVLYDVVPVETLSGEATLALRASELDAVLLYSPRSAETFSRWVQKAGLATHCRTLIAVCISEAAAEKCRDLPLREIRVADRPTEDAMLEALRR